MNAIWQIKFQKNNVISWNSIKENSCNHWIWNWKCQNSKR